MSLLQGVTKHNARKAYEQWAPVIGGALQSARDRLVPAIRHSLRDAGVALERAHAGNGSQPGTLEYATHLASSLGVSDELGTQLGHWRAQETEPPGTLAEHLGTLRKLIPLAVRLKVGAVKARDVASQTDRHEGSEHTAQLERDARHQEIAAAASHQALKVQLRHFRDWVTDELAKHQERQIEVTPSFAK